METRRTPRQIISKDPAKLATVTLRDVLTCGFETLLAHSLDDKRSQFVMAIVPVELELSHVAETVSDGSLAPIPDIASATAVSHQRLPTFRELSVRSLLGHKAQPSWSGPATCDAPSSGVPRRATGSLDRRNTEVPQVEPLPVRGDSDLRGVQ